MLKNFTRARGPAMAAGFSFEAGDVRGDAAVKDVVDGVKIVFVPAGDVGERGERRHAAQGRAHDGLARGQVFVGLDGIQTVREVRERVRDGAYIEMEHERRCTRRWDR